MTSRHGGEGVAVELLAGEIFRRTWGPILVENLVILPPTPNEEVLYEKVLLILITLSLLMTTTCYKQ